MTNVEQELGIFHRYGKHSGKIMFKYANLRSFLPSVNVLKDKHLWRISTITCDLNNLMHAGYAFQFVKSIHHHIGTPYIRLLYLIRLLFRLLSTLSTERSRRSTRWRQAKCWRPRDGFFEIYSGILARRLKTLISYKGEQWISKNVFVCVMGWGCDSSKP